MDIGSKREKNQYFAKKSDFSRLAKAVIDWMKPAKIKANPSITNTGEPANKITNVKPDITLNTDKNNKLLLSPTLFAT